MATLTVGLDKTAAKKIDVESLRLPTMTYEEFYDFCHQNPMLNLERNVRGEIIYYYPSDTGGERGNTEALTDLSIWNRQLPEPGYVFGSSAGFSLPDGSDRSPDAAWVSRADWEVRPKTGRRSFAHVCPTFVVEMLSPSDSLKATKEKMENVWLANGTKLCWLIDPKRRRVFVYRPNMPVEELNDPIEISGDAELPGLRVNMQRVFEDIG